MNRGATWDALMDLFTQAGAEQCEDGGLVVRLPAGVRGRRFHLALWPSTGCVRLTLLAPPRATRRLESLEDYEVVLADRLPHSQVRALAATLRFLAAALEAFASAKRTGAV